MRWRSAMPKISIASFIVPSRKKSMKAVIEVPTLVIVCTPLDTSRMYTPG
jgi:hypothetical protein